MISTGQPAVQLYIAMRKVLTESPCQHPNASSLVSLPSNPRILAFSVLTSLAAYVLLGEVGGRARQDMPATKAETHRRDPPTKSATAMMTAQPTTPW